MIEYRIANLLWIFVLFVPDFLMANSVANLKDLIASQNIQKAYELATSLSKDNSGDIEFDFLYGKLARQAGHADVAIFALERVLMQDPENTAAIYERGLALIDANDFQSARMAFQSILSMKGNEIIKSNANRILQVSDSAFKSRSQANDFRLQEAGLGIGFNSNVNSGTTGLEEFTIQGPEVKDGFANLGLAMLFKRSVSKKDAYFFSFASNNRKNFRSPNWDYNTITAKSGIELGFGQFQFRLPAEVEALIINYSLERIMPSLAANLSLNWNEENLSTLSIKFRTKAYLDGIDNHFSLPISLRHELFSLSKGIELSADVYFAPGFAFSSTPGTRVHSQLGFLVKAAFEIAQSHFLVPMINLNYFRYPTSILPNQTRQDIHIVGDLAYEWRISSNWTVSPSFLYIYNHSTEVGKTYMRYQPQVNVRFEL